MVLSRRFIIDLSADMSESLQIEAKQILDKKYVEDMIEKLKNCKKNS